MPRSDNHLSDFCRHTVWDLVMFGFVQGIRRGLPGVSIDKALEIFAHEYRIKEFSLDAKRATYSRMTKQLHADQRTKPEQAQQRTETP